MTPILMTAVLNEPLTGFLVMYVPHIPKSGRFLILQPVRIMYALTNNGVPRGNLCQLVSHLVLASI
jgi:hypothetical protein